MSDVREIASRSTLGSDALLISPDCSDIGIFGPQLPLAGAIDDQVSDIQQSATTIALPEPRWRTSSHLQWLYPFHLMDIGQAIFVAETGGLACIAFRAAETYRRTCWQQFGASCFRVSWRGVHGIRGVVIRRIA